MRSHSFTEHRGAPPDTAEGCPYTATRLANRFGLTRSALLYYDRIGLLAPSRRTSAGYRLYDHDAVERLRRIGSLREAGIPLEDIASVLDEPEDGIRGILAKRLASLAKEQETLRLQHRAVAALLAEQGLHLDGAARCSGEFLRAGLRRIGLDDERIRAFHASLEADSPGAHADFLRFLGFSEAEADRLRKDIGQAVPRVPPEQHARRRR